MAKRFTDTDKWTKKWFRNLTPGSKLFWQYLLDSCNHAGIWEVDFGLAAFQIGVELDEDEINAAFRDKVTALDNGEKWFMNDFVDFQYGELKQNNNAHLSVAKILSKYDVLKGAPYVHRSNGGARQPLTSTLSGDKDKAKELVTDKDPEEAEGAFVGLSPSQYCRKHDLEHTDAYCPKCVEGV
jgi:hypothetical protein